MNTPFAESVFDLLFSRVEFADVEHGLQQNQHVAFEFAPLCGESLFAENLKMRLRQSDFIVFHVDIRMVTDSWHFAINYSRSLVDGFDDPGRKAGMIKRLAMGGRLNIDRGDSGSFEYDIPAKSEVPKILTSLLDIPEVTAIEENKRAIVIISGFDCMPAALGVAGLKSFNERISRQAITSYVITGSGIIQKVGKLGGKISSQVKEYIASDFFTSDKLIGFFSNRFREEGFSLPDDIARSLIEMTDGRLELALRLAEELLERAKRSGVVSMEGVAESLDHIISSASPAYSALWNQHNSRQKSLLYGLSADTGKSIYSEYFINRYGFGTATNLQAALRGLTAKALIVKREKKWAFADPFFKEWIQRSLGCRSSTPEVGAVDSSSLSDLDNDNNNDSSAVSQDSGTFVIE